MKGNIGGGLSPGWLAVGFVMGITVLVMAVSWYPEGNAPRQSDTQQRSLQKINDLMYNSGNGLKVQATFGGTVTTDTNMNLGTWGPGATNFDATHGVPVVLAGNTNNNVFYFGNAVIGDTAANPAFVQAKTSTNQIHDAAGRLLSLNDEGSIPVTLPAASHVTVVPYTTTSAVADGQALSYNFTVTVPRTNSYLTQVIVTDTETNAPGSMNLKAFDMIVYSDAVTAQTPANAHQVTPAEMAKTLAIYSVATTMWFTNRAVNTYSGGGVVHCPGFARMTNSVNGNILTIPAGTQLTCSLKGRATYTPQATNTISVGFDFLPVK